MTVGSILDGAFRLIRERPGALLIWSIIYTAVAVATSYAMMLIYSGQFEAAAAGASEQELGLSFALNSLPVSLISLIISAIVYAAAQRAVLRPREGGPGFLRLGMDEVRLSLLALLYLLVAIIVIVIMMVILSLFLGGAGSAGVNAGVAIGAIVGTVAGAYFGTKLSLTFATTLIREKYAIGEGWSLTNGHFWTLFAAFLIIVLILIGLTLAIGLATQQEAIVAIFRGGSYEAQVQAAELREYTLLSSGGIDGSIIVQWIVTGIQGGLSVALMGGAAATAAQQLIADEDGLTETFA